MHNRKNLSPAGPLKKEDIIRLSVTSNALSLVLHDPEEMHESLLEKATQISNFAVEIQDLIDFRKLDPDFNKPLERISEYLEKNKEISDLRKELLGERSNQKAFINFLSQTNISRSIFTLIEQINSKAKKYSVSLEIQEDSEKIARKLARRLTGIEYIDKGCLLTVSAEADPVQISEMLSDPEYQNLLKRIEDARQSAVRFYDLISFLKSTGTVNNETQRFQVNFDEWQKQRDLISDELEYFENIKFYFGEHNDAQLKKSLEEALLFFRLVNMDLLLESTGFITQHSEKLTILVKRCALLVREAMIDHREKKYRPFLIEATQLVDLMNHQVEFLTKRHTMLLNSFYKPQAKLYMDWVNDKLVLLANARKRVRRYRGPYTGFYITEEGLQYINKNNFRTVTRYDDIRNLALKINELYKSESIGANSELMKHADEINEIISDTFYPIVFTNEENKYPIDAMFERHTKLLLASPNDPKLLTGEKDQGIKNNLENFQLTYNFAKMTDSDLAERQFSRFARIVYGFKDLSKALDFLLRKVREKQSALEDYEKNDFNTTIDLLQGAVNKLNLPVSKNDHVGDYFNEAMNRWVTIIQQPQNWRVIAFSLKSSEIKSYFNDDAADLTEHMNDFGYFVFHIKNKIRKTLVEVLKSYYLQQQQLVEKTKQEKTKQNPSVSTLESLKQETTKLTHRIEALRSNFLYVDLSSPVEKWADLMNVSFLMRHFRKSVKLAKNEPVVIDIAPFKQFEALSRYFLDSSYQGYSSENQFLAVYFYGYGSHKLRIIDSSGREFRTLLSQLKKIRDLNLPEGHLDILYNNFEVQVSKYIKFAQTYKLLKGRKQFFLKFDIEGKLVLLLDQPYANGNQLIKNDEYALSDQILFSPASFVFKAMKSSKDVKMSVFEGIYDHDAETQDTLRQSYASLYSAMSDLAEKKKQAFEAKIQNTSSDNPVFKSSKFPFDYFFMRHHAMNLYVPKSEEVTSFGTESFFWFPVDENRELLTRQNIDGLKNDVKEGQPIDERIPDPINESFFKKFGSKIIGSLVDFFTSASSQSESYKEGLMNPNLNSSYADTADEDNVAADISIKPNKEIKKAYLNEEKLLVDNLSFVQFGHKLGVPQTIVMNEQMEKQLASEEGALIEVNLNYFHNQRRLGILPSQIVDSLNAAGSVYLIFCDSKGRFKSFNFDSNLNYSALKIDFKRHYNAAGQMFVRIGSNKYKSEDMIIRFKLKKTRDRVKKADQYSLFPDEVDGMISMDMFSLEYPTFIGQKEFGKTKPLVFMLVEK